MLSLAVIGLTLTTVAAPALAGQEVTYSANGTTLKGYIARPAKADGKRAAVLVVHEWWGNNDYLRKRADMLAGLGYVALALDMYGDGKTVTHPKDAGAPDDSFVKPEQIEAFKKEMQAAGVDYRFVSYPGAVHGFTNPAATENGKKYNLPLAYNAEVDRQSWEEMRKLFGTALK
ncbi:MAG: hypothetical protein A2W08_04880 [Candidatus Rokubacteria bacterium RBG_16_73_20]|nr:MAG: hypothetical protein A2W08_04880 [Candidatus Rokubacteria bacterium RBG_16_73_20]